MVAGVFVRVYNEQPAYAVSDAAGFAKGLVSWIHLSCAATLGKGLHNGSESDGAPIVKPAHA